jgi:hypothetical protein
MLKFVINISKLIITLIVCGFTYNLLVDSYNRVTKKENVIYNISVYYDLSLADSDSSYKMPIIKDNYIQYTNINGDTLIYSNFRYKIEVKELDSK